MNRQTQRVVIVTGLSGAGKASIMHVLEDLGYLAVDNPPLDLLEPLIRRGQPRIAVGIDARSSGFDAEAAVQAIQRLRGEPQLRLELIFAAAEASVLLSRYTETRRRHPLAPDGRVADGIAREQEITAPLRRVADLIVDTTDSAPPRLRRMIEDRFGAADGAADSHTGLSIALVSFAYPAGLPREADLVFDARFLRNPHYDPLLRPLTGLDAAVAAYIAADPDCTPFFGAMADLLHLALPRFVQEGKKYLTVAIGCTGGRHRSVYLTDRLARHLADQGWRASVTHRELARAGAPEMRSPAIDHDKHQAQEA